MTLEKRLSDVEASIKVIAQFVKEQTEKIENELGSLKGTEALYDARPEIEELKQTTNFLKERIDSNIPAAHVSYDDAGLRKSFQMLRAELSDFRNDISPKVQYLDKKTDKLKEAAESISEIDDLKRHVDNVDKKVHETLAIKEELDDIEETLSKMKVLANRLKDFDASSYKEQFEKQMRAMFGEVKQLEEKDMKNITQLAEQLKEVEAHDIKNMAKHWKEAKESMEEEAVSRMAFEKRILDLEQLVNKFKQIEHSDVKRLNDFVQQLKQGELEDVKKMKESIEAEVKRLNAAFEYIQGMELEELKQIAIDIKEAKTALDEESINRISTEKRLGGLEAKLGRMDNVVNHIENMEGLDIEKISNRINDLESSMKMNTVKLLTQQLNEFAKSMDRRIPNIVSREEYMRQVADLNQRMRTVEAPDLSPLGARVERLEQKIEEVAAMMRQMYNRVPIVVE